MVCCVCVWLDCIDWWTNWINIFDLHVPGRDWQTCINLHSVSFQAARYRATVSPATRARCYWNWPALSFLCVQKAWRMASRRYASINVEVKIYMLGCGQCCRETDVDASLERLIVLSFWMPVHACNSCILCTSETQIRKRPEVNIQKGILLRILRL